MTSAEASSGWRRFLSSRSVAAVTAGMIHSLLRRCAVTAVAGPAPEGGQSILTHPAVPSDLRSSDARPLVLNRGGRDGSRRVVVLPFGKGLEQPSGVLKFSRLAERNSEMEEEQKIAGEVRSRLRPSMRRSIPAPLGTFAWGRLLVGVETYAGRAISSHRADRKKLRIEDLFLVKEWLQEFHRQSQVGRRPFSESELQRYVERPLAEYRAAFGDDPKEETLFERVLETARALLGTPFPVVYSHGGFSEFNICRSGDDIRVIDWEGVGIGPPLVDFIYFLTVWHYRSRGGGGSPARLQAFEDLYFPSGRDRLTAVASVALDRYIEALSIDRRFFPVMLVLTWVIRALGQLKRNRMLGGSAGEPPRSGNHVAFLQILAEHQDRLFFGGGHKVS